jgi:hypothetical protein
MADVGLFSGQDAGGVPTDLSGVFRLHRLWLVSVPRPSGHLLLGDGWSLVSDHNGGRTVDHPEFRRGCEVPSSRSARWLMA